MKIVPGPLEGMVHIESKDLERCLLGGKVSCGNGAEEVSKG